MSEIRERQTGDLQPRLQELCAGYDRTADMGLFPHDGSATPLDAVRGDPLSLAGDEAQEATVRDQAIWTLVYQQTAQQRTAELPDLLFSVATSAREAVLRRSASWALFKVGELKLLNQCLRNDDDGNVHSWKQHLIYESQGRTDWVDPRPIRAVESPLGYAVTLPLTIHGLVVFRTPNTEARALRRTASAGSRYRAPVVRTPRDPYARPVQGYAQDPYGGGSAGTSSTALPPEDYNWHSLVAGPITQRRLVGDLTAGVAPNTFYDNLVIQKVCTEPLGDGLDHVQGYLFRGTSRNVGGNVMAHYYTSRGPQPLYLSGYIGDGSEGVVDVDTQLVRHAETHIVSGERLGYPYVQSVRGLFFGPARMNTAIATDPDAPLDNMLQIVREPYSNGWFFGEFRSVPVDVDGDGQVEINGMEMYTDTEGRVMDRTPSGPQRSLEFAR